VYIYTIIYLPSQSLSERAEVDFVVVGRGVEEMEGEGEEEKEGEEEGDGVRLTCPAELCSAECVGRGGEQSHCGLGSGSATESPIIGRSYSATTPLLLSGPHPAPSGAEIPFRFM
jgi:hypothetical protein